MYHAQIGDTIVIRFEHSQFNNQEFVVHSRPDNVTNVEPENAVWFKTDEGDYYFLSSTDMYEVVRRSSQSQQGTKDVDKSLARQMDDNLKGVFG